ncbi:hypothetical protein [Paenibacillus periandrae]|uniref:hypothetical protein n=1 Tax=Paenibacillus periandrae TaxID=1761741 RepID=UPI001F08CBF0|nr:hypothetical protein [Paenibacillus periandrae]
MKYHLSLILLILIMVLLGGCNDNPFTKSNSGYKDAIPMTTKNEADSAQKKPSDINTDITLEKKASWALGINYAWSNTNGFGYDFSDSNWTKNWDKIQSDINTMQSKGVKSLRWWVFAGLDKAPLWSGTERGSTVTGLPDHWIEHMVAATNYANKQGIKIYWCLLSYDLALNYNSQTHDDIIDNPDVQTSYINNALIPIIEALKDNTGVMGWDIINEPEWIIRANDGGDPNHDARRVFTLDQLRSFVERNVNQIHLLGAKQPVSVGSASAKWSGKQYSFWTGLGLDFYDFHWYDWYTPYFDPSTTDAQSLGLDKPILIGEVMSDPSTEYSGSTVPKNHQSLAERVHSHGYAGYMPWAWSDSQHNASQTITPYFNNINTEHLKAVPITDSKHKE